MSGIEEGTLRCNKGRLSLVPRAPGPPPQWFAAYTSPRHEKRVAKHFAERRLEGFLPLYSVMHRWNNGCKVRVELPLFPNYIFVRIALQERVRVLEVPGVLSLVGSGREPSPLPDIEIDGLRAGLKTHRFEPHELLLVGEIARIKSGPMAGMEGVLLRKKNNLRVVLTLTHVMKSVAVEVDADDLEPLGFRQRRPTAL